MATKDEVINDVGTAAAAAAVSLDLGSVGDNVRQIHVILFSGLGLIFFLTA